MGWLCPRCGAENRFRERMCRACRSRSSLLSRAAGECISLYERCGAERLGAFAESRYDRLAQGIGGANRAAGIGARIAIVCGAAAVLILYGDAVGTGVPAERLQMLSRTVGQMAERVVERAAQTGHGAAQLYAACIGAAGMVEERLQKLCLYAETLLGKLPSELSDRGISRLQMLGQRLAEIDVYLIAGAIDALDWVSGQAAASDIRWLDALNGGIRAVCGYLTELLRGLQ